MGGVCLGTPHYGVQLMGGWVMARGMLAEMQTGEGKTLTTSLPACTAAIEVPLEGGAGFPRGVVRARFIKGLILLRNRRRRGT